MDRPQMGDTYDVPYVHALIDRIEELEIELEEWQTLEKFDKARIEELEQYMYENTVPKDEANKRIAEEQELMAKWFREETEKLKTRNEELEGIARRDHATIELLKEKLDNERA